MKLRLSVPAVPVAQPRQRHRVITAGGRAFAHNYTPKRDPVNGFKATVRHALQEAYTGPPVEGPVVLSAVFLFPRPGRLVWKRRPMPRVEHTGKPDVDNLLKSVKDALSGLAWRDDSQVCRLRDVEKFYAAGDEQPRVEIVIEYPGVPQ